ncbi:UPF0496 protein At2g18630-like [Typha angustifolia]|uniref:UPF0496 protein At2g18630-like n=1 Tax=Typha angustifolia TaxID=59011 RepID=UPI003C30E64D
MGCSCSKGNRVAAAAVGEASDVMMAELNELYKKACRLVSEFGPLSTAKELPTCGETPLRFASAIEFKQVVSENPTTLSFVVNYIKHLITIFNSIATLKQCLDEAAQCQVTMSGAMQCYDMEKNNNNNNNNNNKNRKKKYRKILAKLKEQSKTARSLLADINTAELQALCSQQRSLVKALHERKHEIKKKLKITKKWRKVWNVAYTIAFMLFLTGSVVFAALTAPPAVIAAATASATAMKAIEPFFNTLWDEREGDLESEKEVIKAMRRGGSTERELESIRMLVDKVRINIVSLTEVMEFAVGEKNDVGSKLGVMEMMTKHIEETKEGMEELQKRVDCYDSEFLKEATEFLKIIAYEM